MLNPKPDDIDDEYALDHWLIYHGPRTRFRLNRSGLYLSRFQYWPPWKCTFWYRPHFSKGGDQHHNGSWMVGLGPIGTFIFFKPFGKLRDGKTVKPCSSCVADSVWDEITDVHWDDCDIRPS